MTSPQKKRFAVGLALASLALLVGVVLYRFDPTRYGFYPRCQFHRVTGLQCPGCGGLRALHALLHGHVTEAFRLNALFVGAMPVTMALVAVWLWRKWRDPNAQFAVPVGWVWAGVVGVIAFGVVRNLPGGTFAWLGQ